MTSLLKRACRSQARAYDCITDMDLFHREYSKLNSLCKLKTLCSLFRIACSERRRLTSHVFIALCSLRTICRLSLNLRGMVEPAWALLENNPPRASLCLYLRNALYILTMAIDFLIFCNWVGFCMESELMMPC